ncbi:MAG: FG-GAP repeat protein [Sandaracinaceae bacterium]|nr:FG-GAP repeat protein [Sandaracinaceae bacterium]
MVLPARLVARAGAIVLEVDDERAGFPITIDPLVALSGTDVNMPGSLSRTLQWGTAISVDGTNMFVGQPDLPAGGGFRQGAVHQYSWNGSSWTHVRRIRVTGTGNAAFGRSVSAHGDWLIVGAYAVNLGLRHPAVSGVLGELEQRHSERGRHAHHILGLRARPLRLDLGDALRRRLSGEQGLRLQLQRLQLVDLRSQPAHRDRQFRHLRRARSPEREPPGRRRAGPVPARHRARLPMGRLELGHEHADHAAVLRRDALRRVGRRRRRAHRDRLPRLRRGAGGGRAGAVQRLELEHRVDVGIDRLPVHLGDVRVWLGRSVSLGDDRA